VATEITERGINPGDLVGDLPDPNAQSQTVEPSSTVASGRGERTTAGAGSGAPGIYRAGGPTTLFGSSGWGPFSDGPLNAVRKSVLSRDSVTEENWMLMMATKVLEAGDEWTRRRAESLKAAGGVDADGVSLTRSDATRVVPEQVKGQNGVLDERALPMGVYEPHTNHVFCGPVCFCHGYGANAQQIEHILSLREADWKCSLTLWGKGQYLVAPKRAMALGALHGWTQLWRLFVMTNLSYNIRKRYLQMTYMNADYIALDVETYQVICPSLVQDCSKSYIAE
jgi:hypothetical protein